MDSKKGKNLAEVIGFIGLLFIFAGVAINFYEDMFTDKRYTEEIKKEVKVPDDYTAVDIEIDKKLGNYIATEYNVEKNDGIDLLSMAEQRIHLVNMILEQNNVIDFATVPGNPFPYVTEDIYKKQYIEVFGTEDTYENDMKDGYEPKNYVDNALGEGYVGWVSKLKPLRESIISMELTTDSVKYDDATETFTIEGGFSRAEDNGEITEGLFTIRYADNYIISITLTKGEETTPQSDTVENNE